MDARVRKEFYPQPKFGDVEGESEEENLKALDVDWLVKQQNLC